LPSNRRVLHKGRLGVEAADAGEETVVSTGVARPSDMTSSSQATRRYVTNLRDATLGRVLN
jgi:hypothetical protein